MKKLYLFSICALIWIVAVFIFSMLKQNTEISPQANLGIFCIMIVVPSIVLAQIELKLLKKVKEAMMISSLRLEFFHKIAGLTQEECDKFLFDGHSFHSKPKTSLEDAKPSDRFMGTSFEQLVDISKIVSLDLYYKDYESFQKDIDVLERYNLFDRQEELIKIIKAYKGLSDESIKKDPAVRSKYKDAEKELDYLLETDARREQQLDMYCAQQEEIIKKIKDNYNTTKNLGIVMEYQPSYEKADILDELVKLSQPKGKT